MSFIHSFNKNILEKEFQSIVTMNQEIEDKKNSTDEKLTKLKIIYNDLIKNNNKKIFIFCLDSFYFQYKLLNIEIEQIKNILILINNRMYGEYYKLYHIILLQIKEKGFLIPELYITNKNHTVYKDLEPHIEYNIELIKEIHNDILVLIDGIYNYHNTNESDIKEHIHNTVVGNAIANFINTLEYENNILKEQIMLYYNYMSFFHNTQKDHLCKINERIESFQKNIDNNIMTTKKQLPMYKSTFYNSEKFLKEFFIKTNTKDFFESPLKNNSIFDNSTVLGGFHDTIFENMENEKELIVADSSGNFLEKIKNEFFLTNELYDGFSSSSFNSSK
jgi:hypothetical protein